MPDADSGHINVTLMPQMPGEPKPNERHHNQHNRNAPCHPGEEADLVAGILQVYLAENQVRWRANGRANAADAGGVSNA